MKSSVSKERSSSQSSSWNNTSINTNYNKMNDGQQRTKLSPSYGNVHNGGLGNSSGSTDKKQPIPPRPKRSTKSAPPTKINPKQASLMNPISSPRQIAAEKNYTFQNPASLNTLTIKSVDVATRTAYERISPFSPELLNLSDSPKQQRKVSPSFQHLCILDRIYKQRQVRQLSWTTAVSRDADPFSGLYSNVHSDDNKGEYDTSKMDLYKKRKLLRKQKLAGSRKNGIYTFIDPIQHLNALPSHHPRLTNIKHRLPMRSDVGFPRATAEEIKIKQAEIQREAELEEASPRLAVLVSEDIVGFRENTNSTHPLLNDMLNNIHRSRNRKINPASIFAPPVDATPSTTYGWRSRPYWDRPPGMKYIVVSPIDITFEIGNVEPLICSMALYYFPKKDTQSDNNIFQGKISEDFIFPAGDWKDLLHENAGKKLAQQFQKAFSSRGRKEVEKNSEHSGNTTPEQKWHREKKKALFSYDPNVIPYSSSHSLFFVIQVHKVTQEDALSMYASNPTETKWSSSNSETSSFTQSKKRSFAKPRIFSKKGFIDKEASRNKAMDIFDNFGTQFLTPIAFGIAPIFTDPSHTHDNIEDSIEWPNGETQPIQLFTFPDRPESQDDFVFRLSSIAERIKQQANSITISSIFEDSSLNTSNMTDDSSSLLSTVSFDSPSKSKMLFNRRSNRKKNYAAIPYDYDTAASTSNLAFVGSGKIFTSSIGVDFTQVLLQTPEQLRPTSSPDLLSNDFSPKLLVDISGDCAIMLNPVAQSSQRSNRRSKRSDLSRLPPSKIPAEYSDSFEVKEILYLPPRANKKFDCYVPALSSSFLNLLYLYPRTLRLIPDQTANGSISGNEKKMLNKSRFYTVRIRLMYQTPGKEEPATVLDSIYNPAPGGNPLLKAVYTKIPHNILDKKTGSVIDVLKKGIPMRDEVKLRLPVILNGGHFLHFSLFAVGIPMKGEEQKNMFDTEFLAENLIPLSNSSMKENSSGTRVTTVIPNGIHRIKLGSFQLQVETRLVSSIHVSDPAVATVLRDFPYANKNGEQTIQHGSSILTKSFGLSSTSFTENPSPKEGMLVFEHIFKNASEHTVVNHFHTLLFMQMWNLVNQGAPGFDFLVFDRAFDSKTLLDKNNIIQKKTTTNPQFSDMMINMRLILQIVQKVKIKFLSQEAISSKKMNLFLKDIFDSFDEESLQHNEHNNPSSDLSIESHLESSSSRSMDLSDRSLGSKRFALTQNDDDMEKISEAVILAIEEKLLETAVDIIVQQDLESKPFLMNQRDVPFSRKAYGVKKTDRMRAEAELDEENRYARVFDDDETVFTMDTYRSRDRLSSKRSEEVHFDDVSLVPDHTNTNASTKKIQGPGKTSTSKRNTYPRNGTKDRAKSIRDKFPSMSSFVEENNFAKRVNSVAQVMIAPCMGPTLSNVLATGNTSQQKSKLSKSALASAYKDKVEKLAMSVNEDIDAANISSIYSPGSDVEDEAFSDGTIPLNPEQPHHNKWIYPGASLASKLRGIHCDHHSMQLEFSFHDLRVNNNHESTISSKTKPYFYECILTLWLQTWLNNDSSTEYHGSEERKKDIVSSSKLRRFDTLLYHATSLHLFTNHIDFLLPLCLKSLALRCSMNNVGWSIVPKTILDKRHMQVLNPIIKICAYGLLSQAFVAGDSENDKETALINAVNNSDAVLDFLIGLLSIIHPAQVSVLIETYFRTLRDNATLNTNNNGDLLTGEPEQVVPSSTSWASFFVDRAKCSKYLRLRAIEKIAKIPRFLSLNFPLKYNSISGQKTKYNTSWMKQCLDDYSVDINPDNQRTVYSDRLERLPRSYWLAHLIANEGFFICESSCKSLRGDLFSGIGSYEKNTIKAFGDKETFMSQLNLLDFEATAIQSMTCIYELLVRCHSMDSRFQTEAGRRRIATMLVKPIMEKSLRNVELLASFEPTHKVRSLWLLCLLYILQEAPDIVIRHHLRLCCSSKDGYSIYQFIELLKLSSFTFQSFIMKPEDAQELNTDNNEKQEINSWIVQESYNTVCAATITLVDECADIMLISPEERKFMAKGLFDLLLHISSTPQSTVTHLRALGSASYAFDKFGASLFVEVVGDNLQHWGRIILTLMNSTALSVRSIAVDFIVSVLGGIFKEYGNIDEFVQVFLTVMPEVVAREIGMYIVSDHISSMFDVECALWPLRRALADVEDANPEDDDRVDVQLVPLLVSFCRTCQAVIDGVVIELRLMKKDGHDIIESTFGKNMNGTVGTKLTMNKSNIRSTLSPSQPDHTFDADEESLFEAANFFQSETAPLQRIRWLIALKSLHEEKGQWTEAAETLLLCARTIADAIPHIKGVWRPSRFSLWHDTEKSIWLTTLGGNKTNIQNINFDLMKFANKFLEPPNLLGLTNPLMSTSGKLFSPTVAIMCKMLTRVSKECVECFLEEEGLESLALLRLEQLLKRIMDVVEDHNAFGSSNTNTDFNRTLLVEESAALRKMSASLNGDMTKLAECMLLLAEEEPENNSTISDRGGQTVRRINKRHHYYVRVLLLGRKPERFKESTAIPTFLEWENPSICRVPKKIVLKAITDYKRTLNNKNIDSAEFETSSNLIGDYIYKAFAEPLIESLARELPLKSIVLTTDVPSKETREKNDIHSTFLVVTLVHMRPSSRGGNADEDPIDHGGSKRFYFRNKFSMPSSPEYNLQPGANSKVGFIELTVANRFPCGLSRQRTVITSEYFPGK